MEPSVLLKQIPVTFQVGRGGAPRYGPRVQMVNPVRLVCRR